MILANYLEGGLEPYRGGAEPLERGAYPPQGDSFTPSLGPMEVVARTF